MLSGCTWEGTRRFPPPILEPVGHERVVTVDDQHASEDIIGLPAGTLTNQAWPVYVGHDRVCFDVYLRLFNGAGLALVSRKAWAFRVVSSAGSTERIVPDETWVAAYAGDHLLGHGVVCFPNRGISSSDVVELHAEGRSLELVFRWESDRLPESGDAEEEEAEYTDAEVAPRGSGQRGAE